MEFTNCLIISASLFAMCVLLLAYLAQLALEFLWVFTEYAFDQSATELLCHCVTVVGTDTFYEINSTADHMQGTSFNHCVLVFHRHKIVQLVNNIFCVLQVMTSG